MKSWLLDLLQCPACRGDDSFVLGDDVLTCPGCGHTVPVVRGIPRFVKTSENYAQGFGWQWTRWRKLQVDRLSGHNLSERRFVADSRWDRDWIKGKLILDAGCGAGRFTDAAAQLGARVVACDLSAAIDACRANCEEDQGRSPDRGEVAWIQGNLLDLPLKPGMFDAVFCMGVIQHTPDPEKVMSALPAMLKPGGKLAYNFYEANPLRKFEFIKYGLRRLTPRWPAERILLLSRLLVALFFPLTWAMAKVPVLRFFVRFLPISATHNPELTLAQQYEWTLLDTFDWLNPSYEICQDHRKVAGLLEGAGLAKVGSEPGLAWAERPA
ncbi:MAG: methyltransferase domain-containing protein [Rhodospirillaceae bacterium]|nr:methyltransferase domain-containing protein [Rhodospirillales bacterium]